MERHEISWFKEFECLCGDCPNTCCSGWVIPLSDRDCERLKKERGLLGLRLFAATGGWTAARFNGSSHTCPFNQRDGLCLLQKKKGHDFLPWTCQSYPRFYRNYGSFEEVCLDLSCPYATRLFIKHNGMWSVTVSEDEPVTKPCTSNEDEELLQVLIKQRMQITDAIRSTFSVKSGGSSDIIRSCGILSDNIFLFAKKLQDIYSKGEDPSDDDLSFDKFVSKRDSADGKKGCAFPLSEKVFSAILSSSLCHFRLKKVSPALYAMIKRASSLIDKGLLNKRIEELTERDPRILPLIGSYMAYYMHQYYLRSFETYSFRRQAALGICHTNMILALIASEEEELSDEVLERIISLYNRRAFFNDLIQDEIYRIFEDTVFK